MTFLMAVAQVQQPSVLDAFRQKALTECLRVDYEYSTVISGLKAVGAGTVEVQGNTYHMKGNGIEIYCDGTSTLLIDETAEEVVIESANSPEAGFLANPIIMLMNLEGSGVSYEDCGDKIVLDLPDGTRLEIKILEITSVPTKKPEDFRPPTEFSKKWIITDLR